MTIAFLLLSDDFKCELLPEDIQIEAWIDLQQDGNTFGNDREVLALAFEPCVLASWL